MFCPKCSAEYRTGFEECSDCHIALVHEMPIDETGGNERPDSVGNVQPNSELILVKVFETSDPSLVAIAKSVLDASGIDYSADGEFLKGRGMPLIGLFKNIHGVRFLVREEDSQAATVLLEPLSKPNSSNI